MVIEIYQKYFVLANKKNICIYIKTQKIIIVVNTFLDIQMNYKNFVFTFYSFTYPFIILFFVQIYALHRSINKGQIICLFKK